MRIIFGRRRAVRRRAGRRPSPTNAKHFNEHRETARTFITERVLHLNAGYGFEYGRIAIRNQRTRWGSCSGRKNLNFNYRLLFLPPHLVDYIIVHELCHLREMNHGKDFWALVAERVPEYKACRKELARMSMRIKMPLAEKTL